jgi:hypothetical protein
LNRTISAEIKASSSKIGKPGIENASGKPDIFSGSIFRVASPARRLSFQPCVLVAASILICHSPHFLAGKRGSKVEKNQ